MFWNTKEYDLQHNLKKQWHKDKEYKRFFKRKVVFGKLNFRKISDGKERGRGGEGGIVMHKRINCRIKRKKL